MKQIVTSIRVILVFTVITGGIYPLLMTGIAKAGFADKAEGSLVVVNGTIVGSRLVGQQFDGSKYFHGRVSASKYDAQNSGGTNLGPSNDVLMKRIAADAEKIRKENGLKADTHLPADIVTASGSGLDPHISLDAALLQIGRISKERKITRSSVEEVVRRHTLKRYFNIVGDSFVNVLDLNLALDNKDTGR
jgi:K+-transporting ATPase ATPase C chain